MLAESRGGKEDTRLKESFLNLWEEGTNYVKAGLFQERLSSKQLKVKPKANNVPGLQLADLIAHPSFKEVYREHEGDIMGDGFGRQIVQILIKDKYLRKARWSNRRVGFKMAPIMKNGPDGPRRR